MILKRDDVLVDEEHLSEGGRIVPRPHLRRPTYGKITQGTVFCCAQATRYDNCEAYGVAITARCDVAQQKYPLLNYLPIVKLADWLRRDGLDILVEQEASEQGGKLRGMLRQANLSDRLLQSVPLEDIAAVHFPEGGSKSQRSAAERFREHMKEMAAYQRHLSKAQAQEKYEWFRDNRPKSVEDLIRRLSRHQVLGHYFLENLRIDQQAATGYVCLLREVSTLPRQIAEELGVGITAGRYVELCKSTQVGSGLAVLHDDLAMPIIEIGSPTIEHVMQSFSNLFGRIGVDDPVEEEINKIVGKALGDCGGVAE